MKLSLVRLCGFAAAILFAPAAVRAQDNPPPQTPPTGSGTPATSPPPDEKKDDKKDDPKKKKDEEAEETPATTPTTGAAGTISLGTNPSKDTAKKEEKPAEKKEPPKVFWEQSQLYVQAAAVNTSLFAPSQYQTRTPTVETWFLFQPRFTLSKDWQLRLRATMTMEWTDTANTGTTTRNEPQFGDTIPSLWFRGIPAKPFLGIKPMVAIQAALPTSKLSLARTMIVTPGATLQLVKGFEHVLGGELDFIVSTTYQRPFYTHTTPGVREDLPYQQSCYAAGSAADSGSCSGQLSGVANPENIWGVSAIASGEWGKWSPGTLFIWTNIWAYQFKDLPGVQRLDDRTSFRQQTYWAFWIDYHANAWLTPEIGYYMSRNLIDGNGRIGNPFFDTSQDMRVYIAFNVGLDKLYQSITGSGGEAGVVRAQNRFGQIRF